MSQPPRPIKQPYAATPRGPLKLHDHGHGHGPPRPRLHPGPPIVQSPPRVISPRGPPNLHGPSRPAPAITYLQQRVLQHQLPPRNPLRPPASLAQRPRSPQSRGPPTNPYTFVQQAPRMSGTQGPPPRLAPHHSALQFRPPRPAPRAIPHSRRVIIPHFMDQARMMTHQRPVLATQEYHPGRVPRPKLRPEQIPVLRQHIQNGSPCVTVFQHSNQSVPMDHRTNDQSYMQETKHVYRMQQSNIQSAAKQQPLQGKQCMAKRQYQTQKDIGQPQTQQLKGQRPTQQNVGQPYAKQPSHPQQPHIRKKVTLVDHVKNMHPTIQNIAIVKSGQPHSQQFVKKATPHPNKAHHLQLQPRCTFQQGFSHPRTVNMTHMLLQKRQLNLQQAPKDMTATKRILQTNPQYVIKDGDKTGKDTENLNPDHEETEEESDFEENAEENLDNQENTGTADNSEDITGKEDGMFDDAEEHSVEEEALLDTQEIEEEEEEKEERSEGEEECIIKGMGEAEDYEETNDPKEGGFKNFSTEEMACDDGVEGDANERIGEENEWLEERDNGEIETDELKQRYSETFHPEETGNSGDIIADVDLYTSNMENLVATVGTDENYNDAAEFGKGEGYGDLDSIEEGELDNGERNEEDANGQPDEDDTVAEEEGG